VTETIDLRTIRESNCTKPSVGADMMWRYPALLSDDSRTALEAHACHCINCSETLKLTKWLDQNAEKWGQEPLQLSLRAVALEHMQRREFQRAKPLLETLLEVEPNTVDGSYNLGVCEFETGHEDAAINLWKSTLEVDPGHAMAANNLGSLYARRGRTTEAAEFFEIAVQSNPPDESPYLGLAFANINRGRPQEAIPLLQTAFEINPNHPDAKTHLAEAYFRHGENLADSGDTEGSLSAFRSAVNWDPSFLPAQYNLSITHIRLRQPQQALEVVAHAKKSGLKNPLLDFCAALSHQLAGDIEQAIAEHQGVLDSNPHFLPALFNIGVSYLKLSKPDLALLTFEEARTRFPESADVRFAIGFCHIAQKNYSQAIDALNDSLARDSNHVPSLNNLGFCYMQLGEAAKAAECYLHAAPGAPTLAEVRFNLGCAYYVLGQYDEAASSYQEAITLDARLSGAYSNLGLSLEQLGRLADAAAAFEQALNIAPHEAGVLSNLGVCLHLLGESDRAEQTLEEALRIDPTDQTIAMNLLRVRNEATTKPTRDRSRQDFEPHMSNPIHSEVELMVA
jgi:tetratricopeptide (TPR) repeat protein